MIADVLSKGRHLFSAIAADDLARKLANGGVAALAIKIATAGLSFLMFLLVARAMDTEEYGRFAFGFSLASFLGVVAGCGMQTGILRWWPEYESQNEVSTARRFLLWGGYITLLASISIAASLAFIALVAESGYLMAAAVLVIPMAFAEYVASALRAQGSVTIALMPRDILWRSVACGVAFIAIEQHVALNAGSTLWLLSVILIVLVMLQTIMLARRTPRGIGETTVDVRRVIAPVAVSMWGAAVLFAFTQHVDVVLLGMFMSPEETGPYFAAAKIANLLNLMLIASNMVSAPIIARLVHAGELDRLQRLLRLVAIGITLPTVAMYLLIVAFGGSILDWFGDGFSAAYPALVVLGLAFTVNTVCGPTGYLLQMAGQERRYLRIMGVTYVGVVAFQMVTIPVVGMMGAAIGTLIGLIAWNLWARHVGIVRIGIDPTIFVLFAKRTTG